MSFHQEFMEFTQAALTSDLLERQSNEANPHKLLACLGEGEEIYDLMENTPDEKIGEVLAWVLNVDVQEF